jgi:dimethylhistidine N-methyltransferase
MNPLVQQWTAPPSIAAEVVSGLTGTPKTLSPMLFYDAEGSRLFEQITHLPEYYLTRTEHEIFVKHAPEMLEHAGSPLTLVELGAGTASKTRVMIRALLARQLKATYFPVDVSSSALEVARRNLQAEFSRLTVRPMIADYTEGVPQLQSLPGRKLVLYIGSSIGNFEPSAAGELLQNLKRSLRPGDLLLLGTDMVKDAAVLHAAYNDSRGITAEFNLNVLARINRELGGEFDLQAFRHVAFWDPRASRVEMHLESKRAQRVWIRDLDWSVSFRAGERIHTENSYKFTPQDIENILKAGGFRLVRSWYDHQSWFGAHLAVSE